MMDPKITQLREQISNLVQQYYELVAPTKQELKRLLERFTDDPCVESLAEDTLIQVDDVVWEREERERDPEFDKEIREREQQQKEGDAND